MDIAKEAKLILQRIYNTQGLFSLQGLYKLGDNGLTIAEFSAIVHSLKVDGYIHEINSPFEHDKYFPLLEITAKGLQVLHENKEIDFSNVSSTTIDNSVRDSFNTTVGRDQIVDSYNNKSPKEKPKYLKTIYVVVYIIIGLATLVALVLKVVGSLQGQSTQPPSKTQSTKQKSARESKSYPDSLHHRE